jgi:hypothetical protein
MSITALRLLKVMSAIWNPSEYRSHLLSFFFRNLLSTFYRVLNASKMTESTRAEQYMNFCFLANYRSFLTLCYWLFACNLIFTCSISKMK